jgi:transposase
MLPQCYPNYKTVHRRFQTWCQSEVLRRVLTDIANELRARGVLNEEESFIDATFAMAKGGGADVGPTKRGKGLKSWRSWIVTAYRSQLARMPQIITKFAWFNYVSTFT